MPKEIIIPAVEEQRLVYDILEYTVNKMGKKVTVVYGTGQEVDGEFVFDEGQSFKSMEISKEDFDDLMAADGGVDKPLEGKPAKSFRENDLWVFMDRKEEKEKKKK